MKLLDPWSLFKHLGGTFVVHLVMMVECYKMMTYMDLYSRDYMSTP